MYSAIDGSRLKKPVRKSCFSNSQMVSITGPWGETGPIWSNLLKIKVKTKVETESHKNPD